jgi:hypothetical protein
MTTTATATRTCPNDGSVLNRLVWTEAFDNKPARHEGYAVKVTVRAATSARHRDLAEWRTAARRTEEREAGPIYTCPHCEHAE